jgi:hypothetical protein
LTRCAQTRLQSTGAEGSFWDTADERFFWNRYLINELLKFRRQLLEPEQVVLDQEGMLVMAISGFVRIEKLNLGGQSINLALISRLSCRRAGTRFNARGIDDDGNVANNVETEILLSNGELCYSLVCVRGSVPGTHRVT